MLLGHTMVPYAVLAWELPKGSDAEDSASGLSVSSARVPSR